MRVSILGFGLIGGSIARALNSQPGRRTWHVRAWSRNPEPVAQAVSDGVVVSAAASLEESIESQPGPDVAALLVRFEAARGRLADVEGR